MNLANILFGTIAIFFTLMFILFAILASIHIVQLIISALS